MNWSGVSRLIELYKKPNVKLYFVKESGHQITLENPVELVQLILDEMN